MEEISLKRPESAPMEALATAAAKVLLEFTRVAISATVNTVLALCAFISLMCWLISDGQAGGATLCIVWVLHFALMSAIDIKKGGVR